MFLELAFGYCSGDMSLNMCCHLSYLSEVTFLFELISDMFRDMFSNTCLVGYRHLFWNMSWDMFLDRFWCLFSIHVFHMFEFVLESVSGHVLKLVLEPVSVHFPDMLLAICWNLCLSMLLNMCLNLFSSMCVA